MTGLPTWYTGDRNPSITQLVAVDNVPVDLIGLSATAAFRMRATGSTADVVAATAVIVESITADVADRGYVRYDWDTSDLDTPGLYIVRWPVTISGKVETVPESVIQVLTTAPLGYADIEELKLTLNLSNQSQFDADLRAALEAASRAIDNACGRRFWLDATNTSERVYTADSWSILMIDDLVDLQALAVDQDGDGVYEETWTRGTDFVLEPLNAATENPARPYELVRRRKLAGRYFPTCVEAGVKVTGQFGWPAVPSEVKLAANLLAVQLFKRAREAPFGIVAFLSDSSVAMRIARSDPQISGLLSGYIRRTPFL